MKLIIKETYVINESVSKLRRAVFFFMISTLFLSTSWSQNERKNVAILVFPGVQIIDYTGPYEVFGQAGYRVYTVSEKDELLTTNMGMQIKPSYTFENMPEANVLVIPGGRMPHSLEEDHPINQWLINKSPNAEYILTVCNGTFGLGKTGLLDNRKATTNAGMIGHMKMMIPNVIPVYNQRYVHDGKVISAGGLSAGIDASLYLVSLFDSTGRAQEVANQMEYNWDQKAEYVRTNLADMELSKVMDFNPPLRKKTIIYEGDENWWKASFEVTRDESFEDFVGQLKMMAGHYKWTLVHEQLGKKKSELEYEYSDENSRNWKMNFVFIKNDTNKYLMNVDLKGSPFK